MPGSRNCHLSSRLGPQGKEEVCSECGAALTYHLGETAPRTTLRSAFQGKAWEKEVNGKPGKVQVQQLPTGQRSHLSVQWQPLAKVLTMVG